jgi:putative phosphoribosyl transferase
MNVPSSSELVLVASGTERLPGVLELPPGPRGMVLFAHGSGSSRRSPRNSYVAGELRRAGLGTLLLDLLSRDEDSEYEHRFDIALLGARLDDAARWLADEPETKGLALGLFGASTGAAAALQLAASRPDEIAAVVSRGGRPDLAGGEALARVRAPTLLIVGGEDHAVIELNRQALRELTCEKELAVVRGATHLFEEPGALAEVARLAARWFKGYLGTRRQSATP